MISSCSLNLPAHTQDVSPPTNPSGEWCIDVVLPVSLDKAFTYRIPARIAQSWAPAPGYRVLVPFRSRMIHGVTFDDPKPRQPNIRRLRDLARYDGDLPVLTPDGLELMRWMRRYHHAKLGDILRTIMPPGVLEAAPGLYQLTEQGRSHLASTSAKRTSLGALARESLTLQGWQKQCPGLTFADVTEMEYLGWITLTSPARDERMVPRIKAVDLTDAGRKTPPQCLTRAPRQAEILCWLQSSTDRLPVPIAELSARFRGAFSALKALHSKNLIERVETVREIKYAVDDRDHSKQPPVLNHEQQVALDAILVALNASQFTPFLLHGVTGSGKTEVYLRAIETCLALGRQVLFLVPEIGLTPMMQRRIVKRFGPQLAILHSAFGRTVRKAEWARVMEGRANVVLGARSALFAPTPRLGLIIVDEEHDSSYKQNDGLRYHARNLALVKARQNQACVVLGSATPSMETWHLSNSGRLQRLTLTHRATRAPMPAISIVDMREEFQAQRQRPVLSKELVQSMRETLDQQHQIMLLINRRGYHGFLLCRRCGEAVMCPHCAVTLTYHRPIERLMCHYCDTVRRVPEQCTACGAQASHLQFFGEGTQQIQDMVQTLFPGIVVDRMDRDATRGKDRYSEILHRFHQGRTQVLVGTQMIAKGHDFHNVTLVGLIQADMGLRLPDFRSAEHTFQLVTQVAGRSGRGRVPGRVIIQTYMPDHYAIRMAAEHDYLGFVNLESAFRERLFYPPFSHMVLINFCHRDEERTRHAARWVAQSLQKAHEDLVILGPTRAPLARIKNKYRFQVLIKSSQRTVMHQCAVRCLSAARHRNLLPDDAIQLDMDPNHFS